MLAIEALQADKNTLVTKGVRAAKSIGVGARIDALRAYMHGEDVPLAVENALMPLEALILDALVAAHLAGRLRTYITAAEKIGRKNMEYKAFGPYDSATDFMQKRLEVDEVAMESLRIKYSDTATNVTRMASDLAEKRAREATEQIVREGMHVKEGTVLLRRKLTSAGIEAQNPWLLETLVRTQIEVAYGAGRWNANQDPAIQEILWGYRYVTVGDARVRPTHQAMHGIRLAKDDPRWNSLWPPNGFNCRCEVLEIYNDQATIPREPTPKTIDGQPVYPLPDKHWDINHGKVYSDMIAVTDPSDMVKINDPNEKYLRLMDLDNIQPWLGRALKKEQVFLRSKFPEVPEGRVTLYPKKQYERKFGGSSIANAGKVRDPNTYLNGDFFGKDANWMLDHTVKTLKKDGLMAAGKAQDILTHEFGHHIHNLTLTQKQKNEILDIWLNDEKADIGKISSYATSKPGEMFAEAFVLWRQGKMTKTAKRIMRVARII